MPDAKIGAAGVLCSFERRGQFNALAKLFP
jgi:hypothetical protein